ncbi:DUF1534 domain-containing protein [Pseudomonas savastanoi]|nr:DUF1534 domain-containing protein [Pseudomonas savastanoi]
MCAAPPIQDRTQSVQKWHADAERRRLSLPRHLSFLTLRRGNAWGDAPRHKSAPRRLFRIGRRASRNACRRGASHDSGDYRCPDTYRSSRSSVGMPGVTLCVTNLRSAAYSG